MATNTKSVQDGDSHADGDTSKCKTPGHRLSTTGHAKPAVDTHGATPGPTLCCGRPAGILRAWAAVWATFACDVCSTPRIWLFPLLTFVVLVLAAEVTIHFVDEAQNTRETKHVAQLLEAQHLRLEGEMLSLQSGLISMRAAVTSTPDISQLNRIWATIQTPLSGANPGHDHEAATAVFSRMQSYLMPLGFIAATWPTFYLPPFKNFDVMAVGSPYRTLACHWSLLAAGTPSLSGPYKISASLSTESSFVMAVAVVMPNNGTPATWGMDTAQRVPYLEQEINIGGVTGDSRRCVEMCGAYCGGIEKNGSVFWGFLVSSVHFSVVATILEAQESVGLKLALFRISDFSTVQQGGGVEKLQIYPVEGGPAINYPLCNSVNILDVEWELCVAYWEGFENAWLVPLMIAVPFVLLLLCSLLLIVGYYAEMRRRMLRAMLPRKVVDLLATGKTYAEMFSGTTVVFADIVSYTALSNDLSPHEVVELLACIFAEFDSMVDRHQLYKAGTIGDAYILMGGAPEPDDPRDAAIRCARCALEMVEFVGGRTFYPGGKPYLIEIRVGLNTGDLMTAVISNKVPLMTIIGDTVNVAARMQTNARAQGVHMSETTAAMLHGCAEFSVTPHGCMDIKGKGQMTTYYLGRLGASSSLGSVHTYRASPPRMSRDVLESRRKSRDVADGLFGAGDSSVRGGALSRVYSSRTSELPLPPDVAIGAFGGGREYHLPPAHGALPSVPSFACPGSPALPLPLSAAPLRRGSASTSEPQALRAAALALLWRGSAPASESQPLPPRSAALAPLPQGSMSSAPSSPSRLGRITSGDWDGDGPESPPPAAARAATRAAARASPPPAARVSQPEAHASPKVMAGAFISELSIAAAVGRADGADAPPFDERISAGAPTPGDRADAAPPGARADVSPFDNSTLEPWSSDRGARCEL